MATEGKNEHRTCFWWRKFNHIQWTVSVLHKCVVLNVNNIHCTVIYINTKIMKFNVLAIRMLIYIVASNLKMKIVRHLLVFIVYCCCGATMSVGIALMCMACISYWWSKWENFFEINKINSIFGQTMPSLRQSGCFHFILFNFIPA